MKTQCEICHKALALDSEAYICSYECTYCPKCAVSMNRVCRNCNGQLILRPKRDEAECGGGKG
ncbi:MAG: DUF1272 domain-containing protein [Terriglobales bacterium]